MRPPFRWPPLLLCFSLLSCLETVPEQEKAAPEPVIHRLTLVAVGDNLFHDVLFRPNDDGYFDFLPYYIPIKPLIRPADIAFVNQETVFAGPDAGFSSWPLFNTPVEAGLALIETGFNVVNHANNHAMDMGEAGAVHTLDFWDEHPQITMIGLYRSQKARDRPNIRKVNNIRVGFLSYTYGLNGMPLPRNRPYMVPLIDTAAMEREIAALRPLVDFLVVSMHWGYEYAFTPNAEQKQLAEFMARLDVDLIIGHHPHVLQPMEFLPRAGGGETLVVYSLGNFLSAQHPNYTLLGGLLYLEVAKTDAAPEAEAPHVRIERAGIIPVVTHYEFGFVNFRVYPLFQYTEELAARHRNRTRRDLGRYHISPDYFYNLANTVLGDAVISYNPFERRLAQATEVPAPEGGTPP